MNRVFITIGVILVLLSIGITANAKPSSPAPDGVGSDCSWEENGETIVIGDEEYTCHCARLTGPNGPEILCRWYADTALPKPTRRIKKHAKKTPAKYGIAKGVINHA